MSDIVDNIIKFNSLLWAVFYISLFCVLIYLIYYILKHGYIRPFVIGHSEPFEKYMETHMKDFIKITNHIINSKDNISIQSKSIIQSFFNQYKRISNVDLSKLDSIKDYTPNSLPYLYILIIFYEAIANDGYKPMEELSMMPAFVDRQFVEKYFVQREGLKSPLTIDETKLGELKALRDIYNTLRTSLKRDTASLKNNKSIDNLETGIFVYVLDLMLNDYHDNIILSYNLRKPVGNTNVLLKIYLKDYTNYIFKETIPDIWKTFASDVTSLSDSYQKWIASPEVADFMTNLPFIIAGIENFENNNKVYEGPDIEVKEHFIGVLRSIAKTFVALYKIVIAVITVITDPAAFIRWLLGLIIGFILYILYLVLLAVSFIFIIPAYIYMLLLKFTLTVYNILLWLGAIVLYTILGVIDSFTGGYIMRSLRCENLPSAWHSLAGYARNNIFKRQLLCNWRCNNRYFPEGFLCKKLSTSEPSYCPHQLIYNAFWENFDQLKTIPYIYHYKPTIDYYINKSDNDRKLLWKDTYKGRKEFASRCADNMEKYSHITHAMCKSISKNEEFKVKYPEQYNQIMSLCKFTYCKEFNEFCSQDNVQIDNKNKKDIIITFTSQVIILLIIMIFGSTFLNLN